MARIQQKRVYAIIDKFTLLLGCPGMIGRLGTVRKGLGTARGSARNKVILSLSLLASFSDAVRVLADPLPLPAVERVRLGVLQPVTQKTLVAGQHVVGLGRPVEDLALVLVDVRVPHLGRAQEGAAQPPVLQAALVVGGLARRVLARVLPLGELGRRVFGARRGQRNVLRGLVSLEVAVVVVVVVLISGAAGLGVVLLRFRGQCCAVELRENGGQRKQLGPCSFACITQWETI